MTEKEYKEVMEIIRQELEDVEVGKDDRCHWTGVVNATTHIQARLCRLVGSPKHG